MNLDSIWPIFVPSKGRASRYIAHDSATIVVEREELEAYEKSPNRAPSHRFMTLPESGRGLAFSRQCILEHARETGLEWFWMIDDDVKTFWEFVPGEESRPPMIASTMCALDTAQKIAEAPDVAEISIPMKFWFREPKPTKYMASCGTVFAVNVPRTYGCRFRDGLYEDIDFSLQVIARGWSTAQCGTVAYVSRVPMGSSGSTIVEYRDMAQRNCEHFVERWVDRLEQLKWANRADGTRYVNINYKKIARSLENAELYCGK